MTEREKRRGSGRKRLLVVAPVLEGTGEIVTSLHVAEAVQRDGGSVGFLASPLARSLVASRVEAPCWALGDTATENRRAWERALVEFRPTTILFADYPLMFFPHGSAPLAREDGWVDALDGVDAALLTFDHFGFAQGERSLFLGPAHLGFFALYHLPALPPRMSVLLPCPMHDPGQVAGRSGRPFRYWDVPLALDEATRTSIREGYGVNAGGRLVVHSVPRWALQGARMLSLPLYQFLPELLERYLGTLGVPVTLVSVNDGALLRPAARTSLRIVNMPSLPAREYEALLLAADLVMTENSMSISMGKAICGEVPCAALVNGRRAIELIHGADRAIADLVLSMERVRTGAVYPWDVFPSVTPQDVAAIGLYRDNRITSTFARVELFGGEATRERLGALLTDEPAINALRVMQRSYIESVASLPMVPDLL